MKKIAFILTVFALTNAFGQTDRYGNSVFNNDLISEEELPVPAESPALL